MSNCGFIGCGDLRSTKRKDVKARLRCIKELLKTKRKEEAYRAQVNDQMKKRDLDNEALLEKARRFRDKIASLEKSEYNMKCQIKEREDEIR